MEKTSEFARSSAEMRAKLVRRALFYKLKSNPIHCLDIIGTLNQAIVEPTRWVDDAVDHAAQIPAATRIVCDLASDIVADTPADPKLPIELIFAQLNTEDIVNISNYVLKPLAIYKLNISPDQIKLVNDRGFALHIAFNREVYRRISPSPEYSRIDEELDRINLPQTPSRQVNFVFLSRKYLPNLEIWLEWYSKHQKDDETLYILGVGNDVHDEAVGLVKKASIESFCVATYADGLDLTACGNGTSLRFLWYVKIYMTQRLQRSGFSVMYSDLDNYIISDLVPLYSNASVAVADICFQATGDLPLTGVYKWGFVPCAGCFHVKPTKAAQTFLAAWLLWVAIAADDQIGLTAMLIDKNVMWLPGDGRYVLVSSTFEQAKIVVFGTLSKRSAAVKADEAVRELELERPLIWHPRWVAAEHSHADILRRAKR